MKNLISKNYTGTLWKCCLLAAMAGFLPLLIFAHTDTIRLSNAANDVRVPVLRSAKGTGNFILINETSSNKWFLYLYPQLKREGSVVRWRSVNGIGQDAWHSKTLGYNEVMPIVFSEKVQEISLYLPNLGNDRFSILLQSDHNRNGEIVRSSLTDGIAIGIMGVLLLFVLVYYFVFTRPVFLFYIGYIINWTVGFLIAANYIVFASCGSLFAVEMIGYCFTVGLILHLLRGIRYVKLFKSASVLLAVLSVVTAAASVSMIWGMEMVYWVRFIFWLYWVLAGVAMLKARVRGGGYFCLATAVYFTGYVAEQVMGHVALTPFFDSYYFLIYGVIIQIIVGCINIVVVNRTLKAKKELYEQKVLEISAGHSKKMLLVREKERKRIAQELHDNIGQQLILVKNNAWMLSRRLGTEGNVHGKKMIDDIAEVISTVRATAYQLQPFEVSLLGISRAIELLFEKMEDENEALRINYQIEDFNNCFSPEEDLIIYRISESVVTALVETYALLEFDFRVRLLERSIAVELDYNRKPPLFTETLSILSNEILETIRIMDGMVLLDDQVHRCLVQINIPCSTPSGNGSTT